MNRIALIALIAVTLGLAGCDSSTGTGGYGTLIDASYPECESQGQAVAGYLDTGNPQSMDLQWGSQRQQVLARSGEQRALLIRQVADAYIQTCDRLQEEAAQNAAQQAAQQAQAEAAANAAASQAAAQQELMKKLQPECDQIGGDLRGLQGSPYCAEVPYYGTDGAQYYVTLESSGTSLLADDSHGAGTSATPSECAAGYYPDGPSGPVTGGPTGHYAYGLCLAAWKG